MSNVRTYRSVLLLCTLLAAGGCDADLTAPGADLGAETLTVPFAPFQTVIASGTLYAPATNRDAHGHVFWRDFATVPANAFVRVRIDGGVAVGANPYCHQYFDDCPTNHVGSVASFRGLSTGELRTTARFIDASGATSNLTWGADSGDADAADVLINTRTGGRIQFMRGPIYGGKGCSGCSLPDEMNPVGAYTLSSSQFMTIEEVAPPSISATPRRLETGESVTVTVTADGRLEGPLYWVDGDTAAQPMGSWGSKKCDNDTTCTFAITRSGRAYWRGRFDGADATLVSPVVWVGSTFRELTLSASDHLVRPGNQVTFTAGLTGDGAIGATNLEVTGWRWIPLDSAGQPYSLCAPGVTSCVATIDDCGSVEVTAVVYGEVQTEEETVHVLCNETGDDVFDAPGVRQRLYDLLVQSGTYNTNTSSRRELAGYIYQLPDGSYRVQEQNIANSTPCSQRPGGPQPQSGETVVGTFHTHPFAGGEALPSNCPQYQRYPAGVVLGAGGGPSIPDWNFANTHNVRVYIIDPNRIHRLDPGTPPAQQGGNPNAWLWNDLSCPWLDQH